MMEWLYRSYLPCLMRIGSVPTVMPLGMAGSEYGDLPGAALVAAAGDELGNAAGQRSVVEHMQVTGDDGLDRGMARDAVDGLQGDGIGLLLPVAVRRIACQEFLGRTHQIGTGADLHPVIVEFRCVEGIVEEEDGGQSPVQFPAEGIQLPVGEEVVGIVHEDEIDSLDHPGGEGDVVGEDSLHPVIALGLVGLVFEGLTHIQAELMVACRHHVVHAGQLLPGGLQIFPGDEVDKITGMHQEHILSPGIGDGLVQMALDGSVFVAENLGAGIGQIDLAQAVTSVGIGEMGIGDMQQAEGCFGPCTDHGLDKLHGSYLLCMECDPIIRRVIALDKPWGGDYNKKDAKKGAWTRMKGKFAKGFRDGLPIGLGYISVSFAFGMMAVQGGLSVWQAVLISLTNVTSAGQFAGLNLMLAGAPLLEMALTQLVINIRYALMSLALSQRLDGSMTLIHRLCFSFCNTDEVFAVASGQPEKVGRTYLYGLITLPFLGWALGTLLGAVAGTILPEGIRLALGVAIYGMFVAIVIPPAKKIRSVRVVVLCAVFMSCAMRCLPLLREVSSGFAIIICAVGASALGAWLFPVKEEAE